MIPRHRASSRRPGPLAPGVGVLALLLVLLTAACAPPVAGPSTPGTAASAPVAGPVVPEPGRVVPTSVRMPSIDVDQPALLRMGIAPDGTAEVPADFGRIGWFDRGAAPPGRGPTVLLGHVDSRSGPAVFYRLRDLRAGDVIELDRSDGSRARYAVERTEQVAKDRFPTFAVFGATPDDVLRLVTCAGQFDRGERSYVDNLVVHAKRV